MAVHAPELIGRGGWIGTSGPLSLAALLVSEALVRRANRRVRGDDAER